MTQPSTKQLLASLVCVMGQLAQRLCEPEAEDVYDPESFREYDDQIVDGLAEKVKALDERLRALENSQWPPLTCQNRAG